MALGAVWPNGGVVADGAGQVGAGQVGAEQVGSAQAGVGQVGAGIVRAPMACFTEALEAFVAELGIA